MTEIDGELPLDKRQRIDRIADAFEREFREGTQYALEKCIEENPDLLDDLLRELLAIEFEMRLADGEQPSLGEYLKRFPSREPIIRNAFAKREAITETPNLCVAKLIDHELFASDRLGRYEVVRCIGEGGFGRVYLARDPQLDRAVALKVPRRQRFESDEQLESFLREARAAARLKHPALVGVYDVQTQDGMPYIVQEYIEGDNLGQWAERHHPSIPQIVGILIKVCEALGYAHQQGLTHCDLKLANVLMDSAHRPHVADFGLAVHEDSQSGFKGQVFSTPAAMAPEQVRGEGHRLDGRTDVWAVGVMLYELLVRRRPFVADNQQELFDQILTLDPRPLRQIDPSVPRELERICLKCLSKRKTERFTTTHDLKDDLASWLDSQPDSAHLEPSTVSAAGVGSTLRTQLAPGSSSDAPSPAVIIPRGLRSFDAADADFFLDLLPGPYDRDGLPESIGFWQRRIEQRDPDQTFSVGLMYGPSGCGKTSQVKAGLLPRLVELDYRESVSLHNDPDLAPLFGHAGFDVLIGDQAPPSTAWDPVQRTEFIAAFPRWCGDTSRLLESVKSWDEHDLRSGICLAIGNVEFFHSEAESRWISIFRDWYAKDQTSGTHSACEWAIRRLGGELRKVPETHLAPSRNDWWHTPIGLTMLRIQPGAISTDRHELVRIEQAYWLSDREVSRRLYRRLMLDLEAQRPTTWAGAFMPDSMVNDDHPVQTLRWEDAAMFCNWLSDQHGFQRCYQIDVRGGESASVIWEQNRQGFRLPTESEWQYACRAKATTQFFIGNSEEHIDSYANRNALRSMECGIKLPNAWGFFDMYGNVWEFCWQTPDIPIASTDIKIRRGASWNNAPHMFNYRAHGGVAFGGRREFGLRVAAGVSLTDVVD